MNKKGIASRVKNIEPLARRWKIKELAVFGSALRDDFSSLSDVDLLVVFEDDAHFSLFDLVDLQAELEQLFGRPVNLLEKAGLTNPYRRAEILQTAKAIYTARNKGRCLPVGYSSGSERYAEFHHRRVFRAIRQRQKDKNCCRKIADSDW